MNVFEYLGLPPKFRALADKVTQLVKHWDEVVDKHKQDKLWALQIKRDGVCSLTFVKDGSVSIWSRTGKLFTNTEHIVSRIQAMKLRNGVYLGEMLVPKSVASLEKFSGIVNPNRKNALGADQEGIPSLIQMHFFDLISLESFIEGASQTPFSIRFRNLKERVEPNEFVKVISCLYTNNTDQVDEFFGDAVRLGEEGIVIRDANADWEAGHKGWRVMKRVRGVSYDLRCVGVEEGTGKYKGKAANLLFSWKGGDQIKCMLGKGWSHEDARNFFINPPIGEIFEVYALEESSKGKLRLPKVGEHRHDKTSPDLG